MLGQLRANSLIHCTGFTKERTSSIPNKSGSNKSHISYRRCLKAQKTARFACKPLKSVTTQKKLLAMACINPANSRIIVMVGQLILETRYF